MVYQSVLRLSPLQPSRTSSKLNIFNTKQTCVKNVQHFQKRFGQILFDGFIDLYFYVINCRCHCGHGRVLPCFLVEDCIMLQRNPRGLHIHRNQAGDWNSVIQHSFPWLTHSICCMAKEKRQAISFEQRITSLSDSCFCDYTCTHDSTHFNAQRTCIVTHSWSSAHHLHRHRHRPCIIWIRLVQMGRNDSTATSLSIHFHGSTSCWRVWLVMNNSNLLAISLLSSYVNKVKIAEADPGSVKRGGRESKFLDAAPENNKNRPKKQKSANKKGGGGPRPIRPPWIRRRHRSSCAIRDDIPTTIYVNFFPLTARFFYFY